MPVFGITQRQAPGARSPRVQGEDGLPLVSLLLFVIKSHWFGRDISKEWDKNAGFGWWQLADILQVISTKRFCLDPVRKSLFGQRKWLLPRPALPARLLLHSQLDYSWLLAAAKTLSQYYFLSNARKERRNPLLFNPLSKIRRLTRFSEVKLYRNIFMVLEGDRNVAEHGQTSQPGLLQKVIIYGTEVMGLIHSQVWFGLNLLLQSQEKSYFLKFLALPVSKLCLASAVLH